MGWLPLLVTGPESRQRSSYRAVSLRVKSEKLCKAPRRLGRLKSAIARFGLNACGFSVGVAIEPVVELVCLQIASDG